MRLVLHLKVYSDIAQVMEYYKQVASAELADEFYAELRTAHARRDIDDPKAVKILIRGLASPPSAGTA